MHTVVDPSLKVITPVGVVGAELDGLTAALKITFCRKRNGMGEAANTTFVAARLTSCVSPGELLDWKFASPPYDAVMVCEPGVRDDVLKVQEPAPADVPVPSEFVPSKNVTVPVGVPLNCGETVAMKVSDWP